MAAAPGQLEERDDGLASSESLPPLPTLEGRDIRRATLLAASVIFCVAAVYLTPLREWFAPDHLETMHEWIESSGAYAPAGLFLLTAAGVALGIPRLLFAALAGLVCGWPLGVLVAQLGTLLGCVITFGYARALGRGFVERRVGERYHRISRLFGHLERHGIAGNLLVRSAPVGNCFVANLVMAVSPISWRHFVIGTFLGTLPETVIYALFGSGAHGQILGRAVSAALLLVVLTTCYWVFTRESRLARTLSQSTERDLP